MNISILYGTNETFINVTKQCVEQLMTDNIITIPSNDHTRVSFFSDPKPGILKKIFIQSRNGTLEFEDNLEAIININDFTIKTIDKTLDNKLSYIHSKLKIKYGSLEDELPEQKMSVKYLTGNEKILEIGGNIGRNSLVIASILQTKHNNNFVVLESDPTISGQLRENRDLNHFNFHIENSALSKRKLIQRGWNTLVSDTLLPGYEEVNTITLNELQSKYNIIFDTLILDCEGAFYYILKDMPEILNNINLIIMENDYTDIFHKVYIDLILKQNDFYVDYTESGGWGACQEFFFEVWKRNVK